MRKRPGRHIVKAVALPGSAALELLGNERGIELRIGLEERLGQAPLRLREVDPVAAALHSRRTGPPAVKARGS